MNASRTARDRARAELTREIKEEARRQLAVEGAQRLSLRAVARELGMVSSALYRYFPSRDDLLTHLIIDAYDGVGAAVEAAAAQAGDHPRARWRAVSVAARDWARTHPHEFALVYGTPVPGYEAPQDTVGPASRVPIALLTTVRDAAAAGLITVPERPLAPELAAQAAVVTEATGLDVPPGALVRTVIAWTQLFGAVGFELFGQLVGSMDPADAFFAEAVERMADFIGFPPDAGE
ncbi:TetR/AcrR family transcriptional regulator [Yinghuangia seranimata]|uniref:TetR/AcrR family transcriptional regulator n=1 Tax=Yinghuangia seranimata TaxID=408067 RepID=UPI00248A93BE|nr:TetR/AcrR family transcriptional regulator [Yinghuangia seranimata]MDI2126540.1 TetR/AcrR family transcriptional regulator [Yinghuangia seranimata]